MASAEDDWDEVHTQCPEDLESKDFEGIYKENCKSDEFCWLCENQFGKRAIHGDMPPALKTLNDYYFANRKEMDCHKLCNLIVQQFSETIGAREMKKARLSGVDPDMRNVKITPDIVMTHLTRHNMDPEYQLSYIYQQMGVVVSNLLDQTHVEDKTGKKSVNLKTIKPLCEALKQLQVFATLQLKAIGKQK